MICLDNAVKVCYVTAASFPEGVKAAWAKLHALLPSVQGRNFYGISHKNETGDITYKAAVEEIHDGEGRTYGCEMYTIPGGEYIAKTIPDFMERIDEIGVTFQHLLAHPQFDGKTPCIEWYKNAHDVICMVKRK